MISMMVASLSFQSLLSQAELQTPDVEGFYHNALGGVGAAVSQMFGPARPPSHLPVGSEHIVLKPKASGFPLGKQWRVLFWGASRRHRRVDGLHAKP